MNGNPSLSDVRERLAAVQVGLDNVRAWETHLKREQYDLLQAERLLVRFVERKE